MPVIMSDCVLSLLRIRLLRSKNQGSNRNKLMKKILFTTMLKTPLPLPTVFKRKLNFLKNCSLVSFGEMMLYIHEN